MKTVTLECRQEFYDNGQIHIESYYKHGKLHNPNGVARRLWHPNGKICSEQYFLNGKYHNENGVAYTFWYANGGIETEAYCIDGVFLTKEQFDNRNKPKPCDNKTVEVDGVKYKLTAI